MNICTPHTTFKNVNSITEDLVLNSLEVNLKMFLDWSFLTIGGWFDVLSTNNSLQDNSYFKLRSVDEYGTDKGKIWEGTRKDWVWESGISCLDRVPISDHNLIINNTSLSSDKYQINYPEGRVILNTPVPTTAQVKMNYSYRYVQIYRANNSEWFNIIQYNGPSTTKTVDRTPDGSWKIGNQHIIQLPAIVIEALPRSRSKPHEIGSGGLILEQDFAFHILADNKNDRNKLIDILRLQQDLIIWLYDTNKLASDNKYPIDYNGTLKLNPMMYPDIIDQYAWKKCWLRNINVFDVDSIDPNMHRAAVKVTAEIIYV
jgi:hypothetical protein